MTASNFAVAVATILLLPPADVLLLGLLGALLLWRGWRRAGLGLLILSLLAGVALSTPLVSEILVSRLESRAPPLLHPREQQARAIVILSGGRLRHASEYGGRDQPSPLTLSRMRYGAWLHEQTGLPILVTGGSPEGYGEPEAVLMARALQDNFKVAVRWQETASDNTAENARNSRVILQKEGIKRILLVTDALHMPRSVRIFERYGFEVVPAPTNRRAVGHISFTLLSLLPQAWYLASSRDALHEWIGMLWYDVRYQDGDRAASSP